MALEGFVPYSREAASLYMKRRWWLGITLGDLFDKACDLYPNKEALVGASKRYTFAALRREVDKLAGALLAHGLKPGDRVLLQLPNWPEFVISYFALQKAGLVVVLLTVDHTAREIAHLARLTSPRGWILPRRYRKTDCVPLIGQVRAENPALETVILAGEGLDDCLDLDALIEEGGRLEDLGLMLEEVRPDPGDVCQILPSGGTTGLPKGAPRTHNDYICNVEYKSKAWDMNVTDVCLVATTVGHNLALLVCVTAAVFHGAKIVMLDSTYPEDFCRTVQEEEVTCTGLVPTLASRIANFEKLGDFDLESLQKVYVGAAKSFPELVQKVESNLGGLYFHAFGMVEGPCCQTRPLDPFEVRAQTIGRPICPYDEFRTLDLQGRPTPRGTEGELAAKGPGVFTGYFRNPQANLSAFTPDGWFRTGDLAVIDEDGNIRITGRIKDIIIRGGENIAAEEVEELISSHPGVEYVAVVGMPDPDFGEAICAFIKPVSGARLCEADIIEHLRQTGASKIFQPKRFEFINEIPLTAAGKADKKVLRQAVMERTRDAEQKQ
ncbi:Peptide arylation enzyme [Syntrophobacter sp. SbD1]|nr:Peptide arylation enzyme [Syntrophobacter sp. SbD1]